MSIQSYFTKVKQIISAPANFYANLSLEESYKNYVVFFLINNALTVLLTSVLAGIGNLKNLWLAPFMLFVSLPLIFLFYLFLAVILHLLAKILGGKASFTNTFQILAYASAVSPLTVIPLAGLLASLYQLYITIIGFWKIQQYSLKRAVLNVLLPILLILTVFFILIGVGAMNFLNFLKQSPVNSNQQKGLTEIQKNLPAVDQEEQFSISPAEENYSLNEEGYEDYQNYQEEE